MSIDYDTNAPPAIGVFVKLGKLIHIINLFESEQVGTIATKLEAIRAKLETVNQYDDQSRTLFYQVAATLTSSYNSWKSRLITLTQNILTQEMDEAESFFSSDMTELLKYLIFCMKRDGRTVLENGLTLTAPAAGTPAPVGTFALFASKYANDVAGADTGASPNSAAWSNTYRIECRKDSPSGGEQFLVEGDLPRAGRADSQWQNAGSAGGLSIVSSGVGSLVGNGGFERLSAAGGSYDRWTTTTGVWATDIIQDNANFFRDLYGLKMRCSAANPRLTQTLASGLLQPRTKYLITFAAKPTAAVDGFLNVGFVGTVGHYKSIAANTLSAGWNLYGYFFNTGADPSAITNFCVEITGGVSNNFVYVDEVCLQPATTVHGLALGMAAGNIDPVLGDFWTVALANNLAGKFCSYFVRWFDTLIPTSPAFAGGQISDALAS